MVTWSSLNFCPSIISSHLECGVPVKPGIWIQNTLPGMIFSLQIAEEDEDNALMLLAVLFFPKQINHVFIKN